MKRLFIISLFLMAVQLKGISQQLNRSYPVIGKPVPEFNLKNVHYYSKKTFSSKDVRGKWLVLDFWGRYCSGCIAQFPKVNKLQQKFRSNIQFLLVADDSNDKSGETEQVFEKYKKSFTLDLAVAYDSFIFKQLQVEGVPYVIVVDPKANIYAITGADFLSEQNLQDLIDGKKPRFTGYFDARSGSSWKYFIDTNNIEKGLMARSVLSKCNELQIGTYDIDYNIRHSFYQATQLNLYQLYNMAYLGTTNWSIREKIYGEWWPVPIAEVENPQMFKFNYDSNEGCYNYSLVVSKERASKEYLMKMMQRDLENYFGYVVSEEVREMPYWSLTANNTAKTKLLSKSTKAVFNSDAIHVEMKKLSIKVLLGEIEKYAVGEHLPFIDDTGIEGSVDIKIDAALGDIGAVNDQLVKYGLRIEKKEKLMKVLVIRDADRNNNYQTIN